ncbi:hypothetical protein F4805DRAFT_460009 [Annulohypoxylon moriforme]|nr:hypothetical protein F4805DRAFT_460009 [Annulohypoxylon moriforme]
MDEVRRLEATDDDVAVAVRYRAEVEEIRRLFGLVVTWIFVWWLFGATILTAVSVFKVLGLPFPKNSPASVVSIIVANSGMPIPYFGWYVIAMQLFVWVRLVLLTTPPFIDCLNVLRPRPVFLNRNQQMIHELGTMATYAVSLQLIPGVLYLFEVFLEQERENVIQLRGDMTPLGRVISFAVMLLLTFHQLLCAYGMAVISCTQVYSIEGITLFEKAAVTYITITAWPRVYLNY